MNNNFINAVIIASLSVLTTGMAQEESPPPGAIIPAILGVPGGWSVTVKGGQAKKPKDEPKASEMEKAIAAAAGATPARDPGEVKSVEVDLDAKKRHETYKWSGGVTTSRWIIGPYQLLEIPYDKNIGRLPSSGGFSSDDYTKGQFPELKWVSMKNFRGSKSVGDTECWVFRSRPAPLATGAPAPDYTPQREPYSVLSNSADDSEWIAYIDKKTLLPVALDIGSKQFIYSFREANGQNLQLQPAFLDALKDWLKDVRRATIMPPKE